MATCRKKAPRVDVIIPDQTKVAAKDAAKIAKDMPAKMTARAAADMVIANPDCSINEIVAVIPEYKAQLPRRSWIARFKSIIKEPQFADLE